MQCSVQNCTNDTKQVRKDNGITIYYTVCSEHFKQDASYETKSDLWRIKNGAVPTLTMESNEDLEAPAAFRVCRICLAIDVKMHHMADFKLTRLYEEVTGMVLNPEDRLPKMLCWECVGRLYSAKRFRDKAVRCHTLLLNKDIHSFITLGDVKDINRSHHKLESNLVIKCPGKCLNVNHEENIKAERRDDDDDFCDDDDNGDSAKVEVMLEVKDEEIFTAEYPEPTRVQKINLRPVCKVKKEKVVKDKEATKATIKRRTTPRKPATVNRYKTGRASGRPRKATAALDPKLFTVTRMTYDEQIAEVLRRQDSPAYRAAPYKCTVCYRAFTARPSYDGHMVRHSEQSGSFECFICKTRMKTALALRKHLTSLHTEKYSCKNCPFASKSRTAARYHERWHAGTKYQCPHCPSEFERATTYLNHIRVKHVSKFVCGLCGYTFINQKGIDVHKKRMHSAEEQLPLEGPYCAECDVRFLSLEAHERHLKLAAQHSSDHDPNRIRNEINKRRVNPGEKRRGRTPRAPGLVTYPPSDDRPKKNISCEQCGEVLHSFRSYANHFRAVHPNVSRTKFPRASGNCMCDQCGKTFASKPLLRDHMIKHTGEKRFKCDTCNKAFTSKGNLNKHQRVQHARAPQPAHRCSYCGRQFNSYSNCLRHLKTTHMGEKRFPCDICGKEFTTANSQRSHVDHVHNKQPWPKRVRMRTRAPSPAGLDRL